MGGEKMNKRYEEGRKPGSPPRGRGKVIAQRHALFGVGITPAWAGKSQSSFRAVLLHGDHPRVGGEKGSYRWVIKSVKFKTKYTDAFGVPTWITASVTLLEYPRE